MADVFKVVVVKPCACGRPALAVHRTEPLCLRCLLVLRELVAGMNAKAQTEQAVRA